MGFSDGIYGRSRGGLTFRSWDSMDLADQLQRLLTDDALHAELTANTRDLAAYFSVEMLTRRMLEHMRIEPLAPEPPAAPQQPLTTSYA